jgi:NAD(P)-dependent dehydrogenase (short-subunit alcohol dehydrogenase family)
MKDMFSLDGRSAVVTGGAGLIGRGLVEGLASHGAHVYIADVNLEVADGCAAQFRQEGLQVSSVPLDIREYDSISACVAEVVRSSGSIDVWVNAAYPKIPGAAVDLERVEPEVWRVDVDAHMNGYSFCCREAARAMSLSKRGSIINFGSTYGIVAPDFAIYEGLEMTTPAAYAAIKGGIINLTRFLASYYGKDGIRVNSVSPGGVANNQPPIFVDRYVSRTPLGRMGTPRDIAGAVVFLASDASAYVSGHNLVVDGGFTAI